MAEYESPRVVAYPAVSGKVNYVCVVAGLPSNLSKTNLVRTVRYCHVIVTRELPLFSSFSGPTTDVSSASLQALLRYSQNCNLSVIYAGLRIIADCQSASSANNSHLHALKHDRTL